MLWIVPVAAALTLGAAPAEAAAKRELLMARVPVHDLDLGSEAGARTMLRRLHAAASQICVLPRSPLFPANPARAWRCRRLAISAAVDRLNAPRLTLAFAEELSALPASPQSPQD